MTQFSGGSGKYGQERLLRSTKERESSGSGQWLREGSGAGSNLTPQEFALHQGGWEVGCMREYERSSEGFFCVGIGGGGVDNQGNVRRGALK